MKTRFKTSPKSQNKSILENSNFLNNQNYIVPRHYLLKKWKGKLVRFIYVLLFFLGFFILYFYTMNILSSDPGLIIVNVTFFLFILVRFILPKIKIIDFKLKNNSIFHYYKYNNRIYGEKK